MSGFRVTVRPLSLSSQLSDVLIIEIILYLVIISQCRHLRQLSRIRRSCEVAVDTYGGSPCYLAWESPKLNRPKIYKCNGKSLNLQDYPIFKESLSIMVGFEKRSTLHSCLVHFVEKVHCVTATFSGAIFDELLT